MPFTSGRGFSVQATSSNSGTWGSDGTTPTAGTSNALNQGVIQLLDQALSQTTTLSLSSSNVTLTQLQCQSGMLRCTGTLTADVGVAPGGGVLWNGIFCWENVTSGSYAVTITNSAGSVILPQNRRGLMWIDTTNGPRIIAIAGSSTADAVPTGANLLFYNASAPSGYTAVAVSGDYGVRIVANGGGQVSTGSVDYSTVFARTATDSHTLTTDEIPSHTHGYTAPTGSSTDTSTSGGGARLTTSGVLATVATGGGNGHTHPIDLRVKTVSMVLATRAY